MTAFPSPNEPADGRSLRGKERITVSMRAEAPRHAEEADGPVSPWLYLAGLVVTLSALYAVNFGLEDPGFALLTYILASGGYGVSFLLRSRGVSLRGWQVPMLTLLGFFFLLSLLFGQSAGAIDAPSRNLQIALTWVVILHSYTLNNNGAVLFACVPSMTMIALVTTSTTEVEAQNAFLIFCCAATFLMVHENYLRTQAYIAQKRAGSGQPALFGSQALLAVGCFFGAILVARVTAIPMQFIGQRIFPQGALNALHNAIKQSVPGATSGNTERTSYELATGPITASESPVMEVTCDSPLYWRTQTFDYYTGHSFRNNSSLDPLVNESFQDTRAEALKQGFFDPNSGKPIQYEIPAGMMELADADMRGSREAIQLFKILIAGTTQLSGAERPKKLTTKATSLKSDGVGGLVAGFSLGSSDEYTVTSVLPTEDVSLLRSARSEEVPGPIKRVYLQKPTHSDEESRKLAELAGLWTKDAGNDYDKALAIQRNIAQTCKYNLNVTAAPRDRDIVEYFLLESKEGYCDSFGSAMTMMCRYAGIPARMATGFLTGDPTEQKNRYLVKDKHRHIWTEVFFAHIGWVKFDATDGAEDISPKQEQQQKRAGSLLTWLVAQGMGPKLIGLTLLCLMAYFVKTEILDRMRRGGKPTEMKAIPRPPSNTAILEAYGTALTLLARRKMPRPMNRTTFEYSAEIGTRLSQEAPGVGTALALLTDLHDHYCYGGDTASAQEVQQANASLRQLREALRQWKGEANRPERSSETLRT